MALAGWSAAAAVAAAGDVHEGPPKSREPRRQINGFGFLSFTDARLRHAGPDALRL